MKSRYCYNTQVYRKIGRRVGLLTRLRRWARHEEPDLYPISGYYPPVYPGK